MLPLMAAYWDYSIEIAFCHSFSRMLIFAIMPL